MATTGFWTIKGRLKDAIDYAENPDKTTDRKFLDEDLYSALRYAANDEKTDKKMYINGKEKGNLKLILEGLIGVGGNGGLLFIIDTYIPIWKSIIRNRVKAEIV